MATQAWTIRERRNPVAAGNSPPYLALNHEDKMVGTTSDHVTFQGMAFVDNNGQYYMVDLSDDAMFPQTNDDPDTFGYIEVNSQHFEVWDKRE